MDKLYEGKYDIRRRFACAECRLIGNGGVINSQGIS